MSINDKSDIQIDKYAEYVIEELKGLKEGKFWGCVNFELHFKEGDIMTSKFMLSKSLDVNKLKGVGYE